VEDGKGEKPCDGLSTSTAEWGKEGEWDGGAKAESQDRQELIAKCELFLPLLHGRGDWVNFVQQKDCDVSPRDSGVIPCARGELIVYSPGSRFWLASVVAHTRRMVTWVGSREASLDPAPIVQEKNGAKRCERSA